MITKNQVKYIQSLSQKKLRDSENLFVAEGPKIVAELLLLPWIKLKALYGTKEWFSGTGQQPSDEVIEITEEELRKISFLTTANQVLALFKKPEQKQDPGNWNLILDAIQDPGNLGTIIRTADWFGIRQLVCSEDCADAYAPKVVQSSMASIGRVEILYQDLRQYISLHTERSYYGATLTGNPVAGLRPALPAALVIGNESKGIRPEIQALLNEQITIPRIGSAESLNAAVATGILLSQLIQ